MKPLKQTTAWKWFSLYRRLLFADSNGYVKCVTCGRKYHYKEMQAGHYRHNLNVVFFEEFNVHPQCVRCNQYLSGNLGKYATYILDTYGREKLELLNNTHQSHKFSEGDLQVISKTYREKVKGLL